MCALPERCRGTCWCTPAADTHPTSSAEGHSQPYKAQSICDGSPCIHLSSADTRSNGKQSSDCVPCGQQVGDTVPGWKRERKKGWVAGRSFPPSPTLSHGLFLVLLKSWDRGPTVTCWLKRGPELTTTSKRRRLSLAAAAAFLLAGRILEEFRLRTLQPGVRSSRPWLSFFCCFGSQVRRRRNLDISHVLFLGRWALFQHIHSRLFVPGAPIPATGRSLVTLSLSSRRAVGCPSPSRPEIPLKRRLPLTPPSPSYRRVQPLHQDALFRIGQLPPPPKLPLRGLSTVLHLSAIFALGTCDF